MNLPTPSREEEIFSELVGLPISERAAYLEKTCGGDAALRQRIERLLQSHDAAEGFLQSPVAELAKAVTQRAGLPADLSAIGLATAEASVGDRIGRYKLLQKLGEGGCGAVYLAEQEEPVVARPASATYRIQKLVRRNKIAFGAAAAVAVALVAGTVVSTWQAVRANREAVRATRAERAANEEAAISRAVSDFLTDDLLLQSVSRVQAENNYTPDPDLKVREALDRAAKNVGDRFKSQPLTEAAVRSAIGMAYLGLGDSGKATPHFERVVELENRVLGAEHPTTLTSMASLAKAYFRSGRGGESEVLTLKTLKIRKRVLGTEHPDTLQSMYSLGYTYRLKGKFNFLEVATQGATASLGQRHCEALYFAGVVHLLNDDPTGARALFEQCVGTNQTQNSAYMIARAEFERLR